MATQNIVDVTAKINMEVNDAELKSANNNFNKLIAQFTQIAQMDLGLGQFDYLKTSKVEMDELIKKSKELEKANVEARKALMKQAKENGGEVGYSPKANALLEQNTRLRSLETLRKEIADIPTDINLNKQLNQVDELNNKVKTLVEELLGIENFDFLESSVRKSEQILEVLGQVEDMLNYTSQRMNKTSNSGAKEELKEQFKLLKSIKPLMSEISKLQEDINRQTSKGSLSNVSTTPKSNIKEYTDAIEEHKVRTKDNQTPFQKQFKTLSEQVSKLPNIAYKDDPKAYNEAIQLMLDEMKTALMKNGYSEREAQKKVSDFNFGYLKKQISGIKGEGYFDPKLTISEVRDAVYSIINELPKDSKLFPNDVISSGSAKINLNPVRSFVDKRTGEMTYLPSYSTKKQYVTEMGSMGEEVQKGYDTLVPNLSVQVSNLQSLKRMGDILKNVYPPKSNANGDIIEPEKVVDRDLNGKSIYSINQALEEALSMIVDKSKATPEQLEKNNVIIERVQAVVEDLSTVFVDAKSQLEGYSQRGIESLSQSELAAADILERFVKQFEQADFDNNSEYARKGYLYDAVRTRAGVIAPSDFEYGFNAHGEDVSLGFGQSQTPLEEALSDKRAQYKEDRAKYGTGLTGKEFVEEGQKLATAYAALSSESFEKGFVEALNNGNLMQYVSSIGRNIISTVNDELDGIDHREVLMPFGGGADVVEGRDSSYRKNGGTIGKTKAAIPDDYEEGIAEYEAAMNNQEERLEAIDKDFIAVQEATEKIGNDLTVVQKVNAGIIEVAQRIKAKYPEYEGDIDKLIAIYQGYIDNASGIESKAPKDISQAINMSANGLSNYVTEGKVILDATRRYADSSGMTLNQAWQQNISLYDDEMKAKIKDSFDLKKSLDEMLSKNITEFRNKITSIKKPVDDNMAGLIGDARDLDDSNFINVYSLYLEERNRYAEEMAQWESAAKNHKKKPFNKQQYEVRKQFVEAVDSSFEALTSGFSESVGSIDDKALSGILQNLEYFKKDAASFAEFLRKFYGETYVVGGKSFNTFTPEESQSQQREPRYYGNPSGKDSTAKERFFYNQGYGYLANYGARTLEEAIPLAKMRLEDKESLLTDEALKKDKQDALDVIAEFKQKEEELKAIIAEFESRYRNHVNQTKSGTSIDWKGAREDISLIGFSREEIDADQKAYKKAKSSLTRLGKSEKLREAQDTLAELGQDDQSVMAEISTIKQQLVYMENLVEIRKQRVSTQEEIAQIEKEEQEYAQLEREAIKEESKEIVDANKKQAQVINEATEGVQQAEQKLQENIVEASAEIGAGAVIPAGETQITAEATDTALQNNEAIAQGNNVLEQHVTDVNSAIEAEQNKLTISEQLTKQLKAELEALEALNKAFAEHGDVVNTASNAEKDKEKSSTKKTQEYQDESEMPFGLSDNYDERQKQAQRDLNEQARNEAIAEMRRPDYQSKLDRGTASQISGILEQDPASQRNLLNERDAFAQYSKYLQEQIKLVEESEKVKALRIQNQQRINELQGLTNKSAQEEIEKLQQQNALYDQQLADLNKLYDVASLSKQYTGLLDAAQGKGDRVLNPYSAARLKQINETGERNAEEAIISGRISAQQKIQENSLKQQNSLVSSYLSNYEKLAQLETTIASLTEKSTILEGNALTENQAQLEQATRQYETELQNLEVFNKQALTLNNMTLTAENLAKIRERMAQIDAAQDTSMAINSAKNRTLADKMQGKEANSNISQYLAAIKRNSSIEQQIARTNKAMEGQTGSALSNSKQIVTSLQQQQVALNNIINGYDREHGILNGIQLTDEQRVELNRDIDNIQANQAVNLNRINGLQAKQVGFLDKLASGFKQQLTYLIDMSLAYQAVGKVRQMIQQIITQTQELDSSIVDIQIATGMTREETRALLIDYTAMADKLGRSTKDIANAANDWLRAGYEGAEAAKLTEASMMLSTLGMIDSGEATTYLISTLKGWKLSAEDVIGVVDRLSAVDIEVYHFIVI